MADLFRLKVVSKRQVTIPQRLMDLLGMHSGDELHVKVAKGNIIKAYPVRITPDQEMSSDAEQRFEEIEKEAAHSGAADRDITELMDRYSDVGEISPLNKIRFLRRGLAPKNFHRSDERIQELVAERLVNAGIDASNVELTVEGGEVTLRGTLKDMRARFAAKLIAKNVLGVSNVHNQIDIVSQDPKFPSETAFVAEPPKLTHTQEGEKSSR